MKKPTKTICVLAAAVGSLTLSSISFAQYRINTSHVTDANNRAGSGGLNGGADGNMNKGPYNGVTSNDIVYGNVTGGKEFRGRLETTDPEAFRGNRTQHPSDAFVRGSSGGYSFDSGFNSNAQVVRPFYADSRNVPPPEGFIRTSVGTPGYVASNLPDQRIDSDLRLGNPLSNTTVILPQPGQTLLPGPLDPTTGNNTLITASSLYGVRQWNAGNPMDQQFVSRYANVFGENLGQAPLSDLEVGAMRRELLQATAPLTPNALRHAELNQENDQNQQNQQNGNQPATPDPNLAKPQPTPLDSPNNAPLPAGQLQSSLPTIPMSGGLVTGESVRARVLTVPPAQQQTQTNDMLQKRLEERFGKQAQNDVDAARQYNADLKKAKAKAGNAQPGAGQPGGAQPGQPAVGATVPPSAQGTNAVPGPTNVQAPRTAPPQIKSFSEGVKAKGLGELLKKSEDLMKEGKWFSAKEQYDVAQQVAPNNMLILIGRANAELGGSYYGQAEADLRTAFTNDPATLEGQYDLRSMIGDDRLQFLVKDLKDIASKNPNEARPLFLLAYIDYNTGNERLAAGRLDLAEKRAGPNDTFYSLVRKHWVLPDKTDEKGPELNKE
jgi:hypothetical protein